MSEKEKYFCPKKILKEIYFDEFDDPCEEFIDVLYDLIDEDIVRNELKKINKIKEKNGRLYLVEKVSKNAKKNYNSK